MIGSEKFSTSELWMVVRTDTAGNTFLVEDDLSQEEALQMVAIFTRRGHKQDYRSYSYSSKEAKEQIIKNHKIFV